MGKNQEHEEKEPMLGEENENDGSSGQSYQGEYIETTRACCGNCSLKTLIIFFAVIIIIDFLSEIFHLVMASDNKYFDPIFFQGYMALYSIMGTGAARVFYYLVKEDSKMTRSFTPIWLLDRGNHRPFDWLVDNYLHQRHLFEEWRLCVRQSYGR